MKIVETGTTDASILSLAPKNAVPSVDAQGTVYYDDGTNTTSGDPGLRVSDGTSFEDVIVTDASLLSFDPKSSAPSATAAGTVYYDDGTNTATGGPNLRVHDGTSYREIPFTTQGSYEPSVNAGWGAEGSDWSRTGYYCTVGRLCYVYVEVQRLTTTSSNTGNLELGLPFDGINANVGGFSLGFVRGINSSADQLTAIQASYNTIVIGEVTNDGSTSTGTNITYLNADQVIPRTTSTTFPASIRISGTYVMDAAI